MLLKLLLGLKKNENKQKEAGIGPYFKRMFEQRPEAVFIEYLWPQTDKNMKVTLPSYR